MKKLHRNRLVRLAYDIDHALDQSAEDLRNASKRLVEQQRQTLDQFLAAQHRYAKEMLKGQRLPAEIENDVFGHEAARQRDLHRRNEERARDNERRQRRELKEETFFA